MTNALKFAATSGIETDPYFANVSLLLHGDGTNGAQNNTFIDSSSNNHSITRNGKATQGSFSPFPPSGIPWSPASNGGSAYFDGNGDDHLTPPASVGSTSGSWTCEFFVYPKSNAGGFFGDTLTGSSFGCSMASGTIYFDGVYPNATGFNITCSGAVSTNTWSHIAVVWDQSSWKVFLNGSQVGSGTPTYPVINGGAFYVGRGKSRYLNGYISSFRVVNSAVYTSNFTAPTAPLTAISNTQLLLSCTNAGIYDSSYGNDVITVGNAQISTTSPKFGTGAIAFDGTGDSLIIPHASNQAFGSGDFTVECFYNPNSVSSVAGTLFAKRTSGVLGAFVVYQSNANLLTYISSNNSAWDICSGVSAGTLTAGSWNHVAFVRYGTSFKLYVNGTGTSLATSSSSVASVTNAFSIGAEENGTTNPIPAGKIDEFRITKGVARYTANFTPPAKAFPNQ
jgi:hypothetical protein